jgi:hypothetical protein
VLAFVEKGVYSSHPSHWQVENPMALKFEKSSEAFLSVLSVVLGADQVGSLDERDFLFEKVKGLPMFGNPSISEFSKLLGRVTETVYSQLPMDDDGAITPAGVTSLLAEAKKMLTPEQQKSLLQIATELGKTDGASAQEISLLAQLGRVFA